MYVNEALLMVAFFVVNLKVVAYLGPRLFGVYSTVLAFITIFKMFTESSGVDDLILSSAARGRTTRRRLDTYVTTGVFLRLGLGLVGFLLAAGAALVLRYDPVTYGLILLLSVGLLFSFNKRKNPFLLPFALHERRGIPEAVTFVVTLA